MMLASLHILTIKHGEVYLHHGVFLGFWLFVILSAAAPTTYGVKDMLRDIRDELRKRNK